MQLKDVLIYFLFLLLETNSYSVMYKVSQSYIFVKQGQTLQNCVEDL